MASKPLQYFVVLFLLFSFVQVSYIFYHIEHLTPSLSFQKSTGGASGTIGMCLNNPPSLIVPCNSTADQGSLYECQLNGSDINGDNIEFNVSFSNITLFNLSSTGFISFTPTNEQRGNHTLNFSVYDDSTCSNNLNWSLFNVTVSNINDPPFLEFAIPNVSFSENETVRPFFLGNHFTDPDGDNLTYNISGSDEANVTINSDGEVIIRSLVCEFDDVVFFTAKDPGNLTATSNAVTISCEPIQDTTTTPTTSTSSGGGGGGGGGGLCRSEWECIEHRTCNINNTKVNRCVDLNGCKEDEFINIECNYEQEKRLECTENWSCTEWGSCLMNNTQHRTCTDLNECGTTFDLPPEIRACVYEPTCSDGVRNGNETGVDCGGSCPACTQIESPEVLEGGWDIMSYILIGIILLLLISILTYRYERKNILMMLSRLGIQFSGRVERQILLNENDKLELLEGLDFLKHELDRESVEELIKEFVNLSKSYFFHALDLEIESSKEDLLAKVEERKLNEHLEKVLASFFDKVMFIEFSKFPIDGYELLYLIEELEEIILQTAVYHSHELDASVTEYSIPENLYPVEKAYVMLTNAYIAMHFNEIDHAIKKYMGILEYYEELPVEDQDRLYEDIGRLYQKIKYRASWISNI